MTGKPVLPFLEKVYHRLRFCEYFSCSSATLNMQALGLNPTLIGASAPRVIPAHHPINKSKTILAVYKHKGRYSQIPFILSLGLTWATPTIGALAGQ